MISATVSSDESKRTAPLTSPSSSLRSTRFLSASSLVIGLNVLLTSPFVKGLICPDVILFLMIVVKDSSPFVFLGGTEKQTNANLNNVVHEAKEFSDKHKLMTPDSFCAASGHAACGSRRIMTQDDFNSDKVVSRSGTVSEEGESKEVFGLHFSL